MNGWRLDEAVGRLHLMAVGAIKVRLHRPIQGTPKAITLRREGRRWWVTIRCVDVPADPLPPTGRQVGMDLGVQVLVATSDGALLLNERFGARAAGRVAAAQRALAHKQRGSQHRRRAVERVAAAHRHVRNCRTKPYTSSPDASSTTTTSSSTRNWPSRTWSVAPDHDPTTPAAISPTAPPRRPG